MTGIHASVQTLIKNMVDSPVPFVNCSSHNLNLVISDSRAADRTGWALGQRPGWGPRVGQAFFKMGNARSLTTPFLLIKVDFKMYSLYSDCFLW